ncbi:MAG: ABC transporter substrate-binding protein [Clostridia bacterium]|nr:ABC transporter substrate-binding protein [Clostridia bacterium]
MALKKKTRKKISIVVILLIITIIYIILLNSLKSNGGIKDIELFTNNDLLVDIENNNINELREKNDNTSMIIGLVDVDTLNPILTKNIDVINFSKIIYNSLFKYSINMKLEEDLVEDYKYNGNNLCVKVKDNIFWHKGDTFNAYDVEFTFNMIKKYGGIYEESIKNIDKVEVIDDKTINFIISNNSVEEEYNLTFPILSAKYYSTVDFEDKSTNMKPNGTGLFKFEKYDNNIYSFIHDDKSNIKTQIQYIDIKLFNSINDTFNSLKNKEIDMFFTKINNYDDYLGSIGYKYEEYINNTFIFLGINMANTHLSNINVRKAISIAIDKEILNNKIFNGNMYISQSLVHPNSYLYKSIDDIYDLDEAKKYIRNYSKNKISINLLVNSNNKLNIALAEELKNELSYIGITINIVFKNNLDYKKMINEKNYDLVLANYNVDMGNSILNYKVNTNDIFNLSNDNYIKIFDKNDLINSYYSIQEVIKKDIPYIGIGYCMNTILYNSDIYGVVNARYNNVFNNISEFYKKI